MAAGSAHAADAALIAAAKKEGEVVWYSTQIISQLVRPVTAAFEKKYPGIKVRATRANATETAVKILNESTRRACAIRRVRRHHHGRAAEDRKAMSCNGCPDAAKDYPADLQGPGRLLDRQQPVHHHAGLQHQPGAKRHASRSTYQDLLNPKWRGKMAWNGFRPASGIGGFVGTVLTEMGEEKGTRLSARARQAEHRAMLRGSAREVLDQVIAGEYAMALQIFNHHAVISAKKGAPVDWIKMEPATGTLSVISVHKNAPHPNAAKLLVDFIISKEGQQVFRDADYITRASRRAGARADAQAAGRKIPRPLLHARADRRQHAEVEAGVGRIFPVRLDDSVRWRRAVDIGERQFQPGRVERDRTIAYDGR